jgi:hypothetical protein
MGLHIIGKRMNAYKFRTLAKKNKAQHLQTICLNMVSHEHLQVKLHFLWRRVSIVWWSPFDDIGNICILGAVAKE